MLSALGARLLAVDDALARYGSASAAVAILLREREGLEVLVTERVRRESDPWSGHWSFPGGGRHAAESLLETVCRETEEEIGLRPREADLLGCLAARSPGNRPEMLVLPFVFGGDPPTEPRPGPEVASVEWMHVAGLAATRTTMTVQWRDQEREFPAFVSGRRTIWGFTYRLLEDLLGILSGPPSRP